MSSDTQNALGQALIDECKDYLCDIFPMRLEKSISLLTEEEIWRWPNSETVSAGNLVLHLCGNVRQWICFGLGGEPDHRDRDSEFTEQGPLPTEELIRLLRKTLDDAKRVLEGLDPDTLTAPRSVQGMEGSAVTILVHVVEHFSYHVGQITYIVKSTKAVDTGFYTDQDLNVTGKP
jgi:uncharacterized damage-inducible protein DinB